MESLLALERKSLADLVACTVTYRRAVPGRVRSARPISVQGHSGRGDIRGHQGGIRVVRYPSDVQPNAVCGTLDAIEAKFGIPFIYASTAQDLGHGARRELALKALHLLVVGAARPGPGADRLGPIVIALEGGACGQTQRRPVTFAAIDFETADRGPDSACAVGAVRVVGTRIVKRVRYLIRPPRPAFRLLVHSRHHVGGRCGFAFISRAVAVAEPGAGRRGFPCRTQRLVRPVGSDRLL